MHNHYRQILAVTIAFYAIGIANIKFKKSFLILILTIAIHNSMIILAPILLLVGRRNIRSNFIIVITLILILSFIFSLFFQYFGYDGLYQIKRRFSSIAQVDTFSIRNMIYLLIMIFAICLLLVLEFTTRGRVHYLLASVLVYMTIIYALTLWFLPDQPSSRIFFLILTLVYLLFGLYIEIKFKTEPTVRLLYFHISLIPLLGLRGDGLVYYFI